MVKALENLNKNSAQIYVGRHVNLHLKDGSVIINVLITDVQRNIHKKNASLCYAVPSKKIREVLLKKVEWAEPLNLFSRDNSARDEGA